MFGKRRSRLGQMADVPALPVELQPWIGASGYLALFSWALLMIVIVPVQWMLLSAAISLLLAILLAPASLLRLFRSRWLFAGSFFILLWSLLLGQPDRVLVGVPISYDYLLAGFRIVVRIWSILALIQAFSERVSISEVAGILEWTGLHGLGFSLGIASNLLPDLLRSSASIWQSLWMRGGLRRNRLHGLKLFIVTVIANALRHAEEIAQAAESRAYNPGHSRSLMVKRGLLDRPLAAALIILFVVTALVLR